MNELNISKKRIDELDMVKGIAIFSVFIIHMCELTGTDVYGKWFYNFFIKSGECLMFLFIFLSGYVFKSKGTIWIDIKNKAKQLLIPYLKYFLLFTVTYFVRYVLIGKMNIGLFFGNTISNLLAFLNPIPVFGIESNVMRYAFIPYWYIAEIFMAFILFIILHKLVEKRSVYVKMIVSFILLAIAGLLMYLDVGDLLKNTYTSDISYFTVPINIVGFAGLLMIGTILQHYNLFDIGAYSERFTGILFVVCIAISAIYLAFYNNKYALQYGKWGQYGVWSVPVTTFAGLALTYSLIYISHYLKRIKMVQRILTFLGTNTLDILLLHFGIGELICMIFGFWYPIYTSVYPQNSFAWWHLFTVVIINAMCIGIYIIKIKATYVNYINKKGRLK